MTEIDFDSTYAVDEYRGIAWHLLGYEIIYDEDYEWSGVTYENKERVRAYMIGDDREFVFDIDQLTKLDDSEYCPGCGQIGCGAYGTH